MQNYTKKETEEISTSTSATWQLTMTVEPITVSTTFIDTSIRGIDKPRTGIKRLPDTTIVSIPTTELLKTSTAKPTKTFVLKIDN